MVRYRYRALTPKGEVTEGIMDAPDRAAVVSRLRANNHLPIRAMPVNQTKPPAAPASGRPRRAWPTLDGWLGLARRVPRGAVAVFTRELHTLLEAGLPADRALQVIGDAGANPALSAVVADLRARVRGGAALSDAMAGHGALFGPFYRAMVRAGEAGGALEVTLEALAGYLEQAGQLAASVRSALIYPTILVVSAGVSVVILMTLVIPQFELLFREAAGQIPWITRLVVAASHFVRGYGWALVVAGLAAWLGLRLVWRRPAARWRRDAAVLRLPVAGPLVARIEVERFARCLGTLLDNAVALPAALALTGAAANNQAVAGAVMAAAERVKEGERLAEVLEGSGIFPPLAVQLIRVGEESGRLESMLLKLADAYAREVEASLRRLMALIEPLIILAIGVLVAIIVVSLFAAIFGINALAV